MLRPLTAVTCTAFGKVQVRAGATWTATEASRPRASVTDGLRGTRDAVATYLRQRLDESGTTSAALARELGVSKNTVTNWTKGKHRPHRKHAEAMAVVLDTSPEAFLSGPEDRATDPEALSDTAEKSRPLRTLCPFPRLPTRAGGCYLRRRSGSPPVGTKRSASRESSHSERNALAASPRRRGRLQRSPCLAGTRAALLGLRVVSCLSSSIDRRYGRKYGRCGGHAGVFPERAPKRLPRSLSLIVATRAPSRMGPSRATSVCAPLVKAFGDPSFPGAPRRCLPQSNPPAAWPGPSRDWASRAARSGSLDLAGRTALDLRLSRSRAS
jgi:transcriptional regulator with XRE-family HTH domain